MSFDLPALKAGLARHGRIARIVIAKTDGSVPREVGASMMVWRGEKGLEHSGTIGGGALEYDAVARAFEAPRVQRLPLGPSLGQCCGGAVTLLTEVFDSLPTTQGGLFARGPEEASLEMPFQVKKILSHARSGTPVPAQFVEGWMIEIVEPEKQPLWIWGAGHVGRALVSTLSGLPNFEITWVDTHQNRFPDRVPDDVDILVAAQPHEVLAHAPAQAAHIIVTYSHALDLELCNGLLHHGFSFCGLIGSETKWARFRSKLRSLGHADAQISGICCPIGQKSLGKHPQAIAIGVAAQLICLSNAQESSKEKTG